MAWTYVCLLFSRLIHFSTRNSIVHLNSTYSFACCGMIGRLPRRAPLLRRRLRPDGGSPSGPAHRLTSQRVHEAVAGGGALRQHTRR